MPEFDNQVRQDLHDVYHAGPDAPIHRSPHAFNDAQPGTRAHTDAHLIGSAAPEPLIERWDGIGPEGFGPVEIIDGRTGTSIARVNSNARRRMARR